MAADRIHFLFADCPIGTYGPPDCLQDCPLGCDQGKCNETTGDCTEGCLPGYMGTRCEKSKFILIHGFFGILCVCEYFLLFC